MYPRATTVCTQWRCTLSRGGSRKDPDVTLARIVEPHPDARRTRHHTPYREVRIGFLGLRSRGPCALQRPTSRTSHAHHLAICCGCCQTACAHLPVPLGRGVCECVDQVPRRGEPRNGGPAPELSLSHSRREREPARALRPRAEPSCRPLPLHAQKYGKLISLSAEAVTTPENASIAARPCTTSASLYFSCVFVSPCLQNFQPMP